MSRASISAVNGLAAAADRAPSVFAASEVRSKPYFRLEEGVAAVGIPMESIGSAECEESAIPAIGISHTFATVIRKRQAQERPKALKAEIDAKYQVLDDEAKANGTFVSLREAKVAEYHSRNVSFPTYGYANRLVEETFYGNVGERLSVAKKDLK